MMLMCRNECACLCSDSSEVRFTHGRPHAVRLGVDQAADLRQVAVALRDELDGGGLHQEGVVGRQHAMDALLHALHHHRLTPTVHELPHLIVRRDLGFLQWRQRGFPFQHWFGVLIFTKIHLTAPILSGENKKEAALQLKLNQFQN